MAYATVFPQQTLVQRGNDRREATDRRQSDETVEVDRRGGDRRLDSDRRTDATNFSPEASVLSSQPQSPQLNARTQIQSTLGNLLQASPNAPAANSNATTDDWSQRKANYAGRAREMRGISNTPDPTLRNLKITQDYSNLSNEMRDMMGPGAGANWATFATWASRQAGETIRQEDLGTTAKVGKKAVDALGPLGWVVPGGAAAKVGSAAYDASSAQVSAGNRKVYAEIAPQFARFIETFKGDKNPDPEKLKKYQAEGFAKDGSQNGLKEAFTNYHRAMFEQDPDKKKELMFLANGQIGAHEQKNLQPEIQGALPYGARGLATDWMMKLGLPDGKGAVKPVSLGEDVPAFSGQRAPKELQGLQNTDAQRMVNQWDRTPNSLQGSGAGDWTNMGDRMNYILDLFRSRHDDPALFQAPFNPSQTRDIQANRVPDLGAG